MEILKTEAKENEDLTTNQPAQADKQKDNQKVDDQQPGGEEEKVTLSKKEYETLQKKAQDFQNSIELKRLSKLSGDKPEEGKTDDQIANDVRELKEKLSSFEAKSYNSNLAESYRAFVQENPWADSDEKFDKIKENFVTVGTETKEELILKFKTAAQISFPVEYEKHLTDKITAKLASEKMLIPSGGGANSDGTIHKDEKQKTEEDVRKERLGSLLRANMTWINKK